MKDFVRFLLSILMTILFAFVIDLCCGFCINTFLSEYANLDIRHAKKGYSQVAIIGASVTFNQYNPKIISDSLQMSVYNYGAGGQNIYYHYCLVHYLLECSSHKPEIIVYNPCYIDISDEPGWNTEKLNALYFDYSNDPTIRSTIELQGVKNVLFLNISKIYAHNSQVFNYIKNLFRSNKSSDGYMPLSGEWKEPLQDNFNVDLLNDRSKVDYFLKMIGLIKSNNIPFYIAIAPVYLNYQKEESWQSFIKKVSKENNIPILDYTGDSLFIQHPEWYYNPMHLNDRGTTVFSSVFSHDLKTLLK